jgi:signal transduction histidine kinase
MAAEEEANDRPSQTLSEPHPNHGDRARTRQRILFWCAGIVALFAPADWLALGRFAWPTLVVRLAWIAAILLGALALRGAGPQRIRALVAVLAGTSTVFYGALVQLTGGREGPLFGWMVVFPVAVALLVQDHPGAIVTTGAALLVCGLGILVGSGAAPGYATLWAVQAVVMTWLALYASHIHRKMREREMALRTARDEAAAQMRASDAAVAARDEFLAVAAHELRTPLTSLLLHIEAMERGVPTPAVGPSGRFAAGEVELCPTDPFASGSESVRAVRSRFDAVARQARRLSALIDGMLDVSRLTGGRLELELTELDLAGLVRELVQRFAADALAAGCTLTVRTDAPLRGVWDPARLDQILTNLVANALKYGAGSPIEVEAHGGDERVWLTVRDHGIGIAPADQHRIFQRFERAASERHYGGLGLGLWIASELTKGLGGEIAVDSAPGAGAAFTVTLPRRTAHARPTPTASRIPFAARSGSGRGA